MAWQPIPEEKFKIVLDTPKYLSAEKNVWLTLEYDDDESYLTPTSVRIRFKLSSKNNSNYWDQFFILIPQNEYGAEKFIKIKEKWTGNGGAKYPYYWPADDEVYTLTKSYTDATFKIPSFYFINGGQDATVAPGYGYTAADVTTLAQAYHIVNTNSRQTIDGIPVVGRANYTQVVELKSIDISTDKTIATPGDPPTLTLHDNGDNTVIATVTLDIDGGDNNKLESATLYYTTDGTTAPSAEQTDPKPVILSTTTKNYSTKITAIGDNKPIQVLVKCIFEHNSAETSDQITANYYIKPKNPGKPRLTDSSFKNKRLTIKQDWGWEWPLANAANNQTYNAVKGYRVRLFVDNSGDGVFTNEPIKYNGNLISTELSAGDWVYDRTSTDYPMLMRAVDQGIVPGYQVKLSVQAYSANDKGTKLFSDEVFSDPYLVENAGVVNVKVPDLGWVEGQVWVKADGEWHEAETVNVKVADLWHESK